MAVVAVTGFFLMLRPMLNVSCSFRDTRIGVTRLVVISMRYVLDVVDDFFTVQLETDCSGPRA
jgi:hypothetical protein